MTQHLNAEHGVACAMVDQQFGYFGWPTVGLMEDGTLVAVASGLRFGHICPYGRTVFLRSTDEGRTWASPRVVNDTPYDNRDAGVISLGGERLLISWFTSDTRYYAQRPWVADNPEIQALWAPGMAWQTDEAAERFVGSWVRVSEDAGDTWLPPVKVPLTTPHGPIRLRDGSLFYFGRDFGTSTKDFAIGHNAIGAITSHDGQQWSRLGKVPLYPGTIHNNYHEPHAVELPSGKIIGHIRFQSSPDLDVTTIGLTQFSIMQTESEDGGNTWTEARPLGFHGSPPHLLRHSSGALVCSYGYRLEPYGERIAISRDEGQTWQHDYILHDDGPDHDLGYPSSVELPDGSIFTLYYQKPSSASDKCALLWSRWRLPE